jgi:predicted nucleic acid-binding protein
MMARSRAKSTPNFLKRQCWDSAMFISLVTKPKTDEGSKRVEKIKELLALHEQKKIEIVVSTMAIVEFRPYQDQASHDPALVQFVDALFNSTDIELYGLTPGIAALAREIGEKQHALTPTDTIHIATAVIAKADVLFTFDGDGKIGKRRRQKEMIANDGKFGTPPLKISAPYVDFGPMFEGQTT